MQPKVKVTLSIFTFLAMVLTGLAAAEQLPKPDADETLLSPSIISLSPKVVGSHAKPKQDVCDSTAVQTTEKTSTLPISN